LEQDRDFIDVFEIKVNCTGENSFKKYPETIGKEGTRFEKNNADNYSISIKFVT